MSTRTPIELIEIVAGDLGAMCDDVVFVGGAIVGLLITDPAAPPISATKDVDIIVSVTSNYAYSQQLGERLRRLGFSEDSEEGAPLCRWRRRDGIKLDVMPTDPGILGFSNRWCIRSWAAGGRHAGGRRAWWNPRGQGAAPVQTAMRSAERAPRRVTGAICDVFAQPRVVHP